MSYSKPAHPSRATAALRRTRRRIAVVVGLLALAALAGARLRSGATAPAATTPTSDPRLIVRAHTVRIAGTLGDLAVHGTLYPGLPGGNMVRLAVGGTSAPAPSAYLTLLVTMPGMRMAPVRAMLPARGGAFSGLVPLPMFGSYTARLTLARNGMRQQGRIQLSVPLQLSR